MGLQEELAQARSQIMTNRVYLAARQIENEERTLNELQRQVRESKARLDVLIERWEEASAWEDAWEEAVKLKV